MKKTFTSFLSVPLPPPKKTTTCTHNLADLVLRTETDTTEDALKAIVRNPCKKQVLYSFSLPLAYLNPLIRLSYCLFIKLPIIDVVFKKFDEVWPTWKYEWVDVVAGS